MKSKPITTRDKQVYQDWGISLPRGPKKRRSRVIDERKYQFDFYNDWRCGETGRLETRPWCLDF